MCVSLYNNRQKLLLLLGRLCYKTNFLSSVVARWFAGNLLVDSCRRNEHLAKNDQEDGAPCCLCRLPNQMKMKPDIRRREKIRLLVVGRAKWPKT